MGVQACRLPAPKPLKRSKPSKPSKPSQPSKRQNPCNLQPTGVQRLASNAGHSDPTARSIASSKAARPSQPTGVPRPHPWLLMGVQACRLPAPKPLKRSKPSKPSKRSKPSQPPKRQNPCNLQPTGVQRLASNAGHSDPTARSIASSKAARPSQPTGVPRPHPWLLMGVQACRLPAPKPLKRSKPSKPSKRSKPSQPPKRQNPCNLQPTGVQRLASNAGHSDPTARSIASSKAARPSQPTGVPRPHPWLLMGVQARLPAPKPLNTPNPPNAPNPLNPQNVKALATFSQQASRRLPPTQATATPRPDPLLLQGDPKCRSPGLRSQQASQGHIHGFLWASKLAVCQPLNP